MSYLVTLLSRQFLAIAAKSLTLATAGAAIHPALALHEHSPTRATGAPDNAIAFELDSPGSFHDEMRCPVSFAGSDDFASETLYVPPHVAELPRTERVTVRG
jgi:hypothetical protein